MKPRTLDRTRPFGNVYGLGGVDHEQDGLYFTKEGKQVKVDDVSPPTEEPAPVAIDDGSNVKPATVVDSPEPPEQPTKFDDMHHMQLRSAVKMFGGEYQSREQAIAFLKGRAA